MDKTIDIEDAADHKAEGFWFTSMTTGEKKTFWGCFWGWALDAFDVQIYSLVIPALLVLGFISSKSDAGFIATVALLTSAIGGWLAGALSDRVGRVRILQLTVLWFAVFTMLSGFAQNSTQLMLARALMGFGFGGEWAAGAVLISEAVQPRYRGRAVGTVQSGWAIGWGLAVLAFVVVFSLAPAEWAWRSLFFLGILPALLVLYLRKHVNEPELRGKASTAYKSDEATARTAGRPKHQSSLLAIFRPGLVKKTILCSLVAVGAQGGYYALTIWLPEFLAAERGLKVLAVGGTLAVVIAGAFCGYLFGAWLSDKLGRRKAIVYTAIAAIIVVLPFTLVDLPTVVFTIMGFPLGFCASAYFSGIGAFFAEQFPTESRGSGQGFSYNFGRGIGAFFPFLVGYVGSIISLGTAIAIFAGSAYTIMAIATLLLPETRGLDLQSEAVAA